jgi:SAM-dependent methyltransferase
VSSSNFATWEQAVAWLREQPAQHQLVLDSYYDDPLAAAADRYWRSAEWQAVHPLLGPSRGVAVDIGAGRGIASYALAKDGFRVTALEPDPSDLVGAGAIRAMARDANLPIEVAIGYSEAIPLPDAGADLVFARATLHHAQDLRKACKEFFRILKPGGRLLAVREHVISRHTDLAAFLEIHPLHHIYGGEHAFLLAEYREAFTLAGFRVTRTFAPLESALNYAPQTPQTLREGVVARLGKVPPLAALANMAMGSKAGLAAALRLLSLVDSRPGRLYSFVCDKPGN